MSRPQWPDSINLPSGIPGTIQIPFGAHETACFAWGAALAACLPEKLKVDVLWVGVFTLLAIALIRRHGWEYVPIVILLAGGRWYTSGMGIGSLADSVTLASFAGIWFVTARTRVDD